ncbi:MAG: phytanoyl-CoA dioxygenase family protein [Rickettsiales bacterium]|nr:phytanoyl-CoA dioxygenase family protein [Rickettsiales bacterium]
MLSAIKNLFRSEASASVPKWERMPVWEDLVEDMPDAQVPMIDRKVVDESQFTEDQKTFRDQGFLILENFLPKKELNAYIKEREKLKLPGGYPTPIPYMNVDQIKDLCLIKPLADKLEELFDKPMGMHLNLTGWVSTERNWHQDEYLNPPGVDGWYVAVWMALDDIHPDAGPFEYVPGSHKWDLVRRDKVLEWIEPEERKRDTWPKTSERFLTELFEKEVKKHGIESRKFIAKKGDVLIWHSRLMHRGTKPNNPDLERRTIITHFSAIDKRPDMAKPIQHKDGGYYFPFKAAGQPDNSMMAA